MQGFSILYNTIRDTKKEPNSLEQTEKEGTRETLSVSFGGAQ